MMELQADSRNPHLLMLELEFVPEDAHDADPATVGEVSRDVVTALQNNGHTVQPVYTGKRGDFLFAIPLVFHLVGQAIATNKDLLIELLKTIEPMIESIFKERDKKAPADKTQSQVKVAIEINGASISIEAPDVESAERLARLADKFRSDHPTAAEKITPHSAVKITGRVPKSQPHRRR
jgi:hypothetical protein